MNLIVKIWNWLMAGLPGFQHEVDITRYLPKMATVSLLVGLGCAVVILVLLALLNKFRGGKWNVPGKLLTSLFIATWFLGFVVYEIGIYTGEPISLLTNAPMAMIHAFEMFILENDTAALHHQFHENVTFMFFFSLAHFLAAGVSMIFVVKHFGFNIVAGFRMFFEAYFKKHRRETFVFWGMNEPSYLLAKNIKDNRADKSDYRIIIVRTGSDGERTSVRNGIDRMFNFLSLKNKDLERLQDLECLTANTFTDLSKLNVAVPQDGQTVDVLKKRLRLRQLARILSRKTTSTIHLFFMSDDATSNIQSVGNLKKDKWLNDFADKGRLNFYCLARYNSVHRVIEDEPSHPRIEVKVVDSSRMSVQLLKQSDKLHLQPVSYVDIQPDATVVTPFNALVVGFSEVGLDMLRFLYEFGAFVHSGGDADHAERSPFHCSVVDRDMDARAGQFVANAPSINPVLNPLDEVEAAKSMVSLYQMDCRSAEFYKKLEYDWLPTLNYVVLATGDDELNISHAVRIFRMAIRYRPDLEKFRIMVRVQHDENGHLAKIAAHYNRLWAAEQASRSADHLHQKAVLSSQHIDGPITLFGSAQEIYTADLVINEALKLQAQLFKRRYDQSMGAINRQKSDSLDWNEEQNDLMQLTGEYAGFAPTFSGMMRLRRTQSQNHSNSQHLETKRALAVAALGEDKLEEVRRHGLDRSDGETTYRWHDNASLPIDDVQRVMDVLAQTEHLRWNASHEILGYRDKGNTTDVKDEARLVHGCIKSWEQLEDAVRSFDYNVVDMALDVRSARS